jgi:hypothetical protein
MICDVYMIDNHETNECKRHSDSIFFLFELWQLFHTEQVQTYGSLANIRTMTASNNGVFSLSEILLRMEIMRALRFIRSDDIKIGGTRW